MDLALVECSSHYVALLNSDGRPEPDMLATLVEALERDRGALWAAPGVHGPGEPDHPPGPPFEEHELPGMALVIRRAEFLAPRGVRPPVLLLQRGLRRLAPRPRRRLQAPARAGSALPPRQGRTLTPRTGPARVLVRGDLGHAPASPRRHLGPCRAARARRPAPCDRGPCGRGWLAGRARLGGGHPRLARYRRAGRASTPPAVGRQAAAAVVAQAKRRSRADRVVADSRAMY